VRQPPSLYYRSFRNLQYFRREKLGRMLFKESYAGLSLPDRVNLYDPYKEGGSDENLEGTMKDSRTNYRQRDTVLVIHNDAAVLVLVRGILAEHYRVLLAADAESAVRLAMLEGVSIDLALIGRNTPGVRNSRELQRRLTAIRPDLGILSMVGSVEDQVIKIRMVGIPKAHIADDFLAQVRWALGVRSLRRTLASNRVRADLPAQERTKIGRMPLVARAGATMQ
jgi:hypothetical protein